MKTIRLLDTGAIGSAIARLLVNAGLPVSIANSRGPQSLTDLANELGPRARPVTAQEASRADMVFLAVNWSKIPEAVRDLGPWDGRIVIDTNNPIEAPLFQPVDLHGVPSSQVIAQLLPGAHVVKAFNTIFAQLLAPEARQGKAPVQVFVAGDDAGAKDRVRELARALAFEPVEAGPLRNSRYLEPVGGMNIQFGFFLGWGPTTAPAWVRA